ncbi:MAG TPA: pseudouridine synthase [bacterium]|nr:pseudouridine synthase [bacterium]
MALINLTKHISASGFCSRRAAEEFIRSGQVTVDSKPAVLGQKVDPATAQVKVLGRLVAGAEKMVYYLVNKPIGYICTTKDIHAKNQVVDLVPPMPKVWPVGRLDKDSRGLVILTNDGALTYELTHPKFEHQKEYLATLDKDITLELLLKLKQGVKLEEGLAKADSVKKVSPTKLSIVIHQGWNRQIRRMLGACGYRVKDLVRVRIGKMKLGELPSGKFREVKFLISNY